MKKMLLYLLLICGMSALRVGAEVQVIAHPDLASSSVTAKNLEDLYLGRKKTLPDAGKVVPVDLSSGETHTAFLKAYVKRSASQYKSHWKKAVFTGQGKPPKKFKTDAEVVAYVAATPGAVGYVSSGADVSTVKVLSVN